MKVSEALLYASDLETGAFRRSDVEVHRAALDLENLVNGREQTFALALEEVYE